MDLPDLRPETCGDPERRDGLNGSRQKTVSCTKVSRRSVGQSRPSEDAVIGPLTQRWHPTISRASSLLVISVPSGQAPQWQPTGRHPPCLQAMSLSCDLTSGIAGHRESSTIPAALQAASNRASRSVCCGGNRSLNGFTDFAHQHFATDSHRDL